LSKKTALPYLEFFFLAGLLLRFSISGRIYYWSNYLFLAWFSLAYFLALLAKKNSFPMPRMLRLGLGLFFAGLIVSMPFGLQQLYSARELVIFLSYLFVFLAGLELLDEQTTGRMILLIIFAAALSALLGLRQYFGGLQNLAGFEDAGDFARVEQVQLKRIFGLTFSSDFFSGSLAASLVLIPGCYRQLVGGAGTRKALNLALLFLLILVFLAAMVLSKSIGGLLSLMVGVLGLIYLWSPQSLLGRKTLAAALALVVLTAGVCAIFIYHRRSLIFEPGSNPVLLRLHNFSAGVKVFQERPLLGTGLGDFWIAYPKYRQRQANESRYAHNNFLQILAEAGPIAEAGLLLLVLYPLLGLRKIKAGKDPALSSIFSALLVLGSHWLWDYGLYVPELASVFFVLLAALAVKREGSRTPRPLSRTALALMATLLAVLWAASVWIFAEQRLVKNADRFLFRKNPAAAAASAGRALRLIPADDRACAILAAAAAQKGDKESVVTDYYRRAIALNPRFAFSHRDLGDYYYHHGQIDAAEAEYARALELYPNNLDFLVRLARVNRLQGNLAGAEKYARQALSVQGSRPLALWEMAKIKLAQGRRDDLLMLLRELWEKYQDPGARRLLDKYGGGKTP